MTKRGVRSIITNKRTNFRLRRSVFREVQAISSKHKDAAADTWTFICLATTSATWDESIDFICTVKYDAFDPDEREILFVLKQYTGDAFGVAHWYKLSSKGGVTEYEEHPYDLESFEASWKSTEDVG